MTVTTDNSRISYAGDGSTGTFPFPYYFLSATDIKVFINFVEQTSGYTVSGAGVRAGGSVQITPAPAVGSTVLLVRDPDLLQETDLPPNDPFPSEAVEKALDKLTMIVQAMNAGQSNTVHFPLSETVDGELPLALQRANKVYAFDANGVPSLVPLPASVGAGDMRDEIGSDGKPGLIVGTDIAVGATVITLSRAPVGKANVTIQFDSAYQGGDQIASLVGNVLTLVSPGVPGGISRVYIRTGTTLSLNTPAQQSVTDDSVAPGTALYDRIANNFSLMDPRFAAADFTARVQAALDFVGQRGGGIVHVGDGVSGSVVRSIYFNYPLTSLVGNNADTNTFQAPAAAGGIDAQAMFKILADGCQLIGIGADGNIANNTGNAFGAVWSDGRSNTLIEKCHFRNFIGDGITLYSSAAARQNYNFKIRNNTIENMGWGGITVFFGVTGKIEGNRVISCGSSAIRTDGVVGNIDLGVSFGVDIVQNYVNRGAPPTVVRGGGLENGFMIVYGAGDQHISVQDNFCYDNRNAAEDGIGLGQDGVHNNIGCIVQGNIVAYAGLFGIDATNESTVVDNVILYSTQCGIKVGTDAGGNCTSVLIKDNLIVNPNNPTARFPSVQDMGIHVATTVVPAIYSGIRITGNKVIDYRSGAAQLTKYGLEIAFVNNLTYTNNDFSDNDFTSVGIDGVFAPVTMPRETGWTYSNNKHPNALRVVSGTVLNVFGREKVTVTQSGPTTVTDILGGFDGCDLSVQHNDGNTTWKFNSNPLMYGNGSTNLTPTASNWTKFERFNSAWAGYRTVQ